MGCEVELQVWPRMFHVWHMFARILPEARAAIARIGAFLQAQHRAAVDTVLPAAPVAAHRLAHLLLALAVIDYKPGVSAYRPVVIDH